ncbi:HAD family hydrolase [Candidatus Bathyarchaeota archaeon]|nr:HAD family hydrolase [Candidatus Bathyarchaeota archaeon]
MIKAVLFDFWDTLVPSADEFAYVREQAKTLSKQLAKFGYPVKLGVMIRAFLENHQACEEERDRTEIEVPVNIEVARLIELLGFPVSPELIRKLTDAFQRVFIKYIPSPRPDAIQALRILKSSGFKLGIVSNTSCGKCLRYHLEKHLLMQCLNAAVFSDEVGYRKPNQKIFRDALTQLGVTAEEAIHVGDNLYADIQGAKQLGMKTILYSEKILAKAQPKPDIVITTFKQLPEYVYKLSVG